MLKCDIRKFFDSVNHAILIRTLKKVIDDDKVMHLLENIIHSFETRPGNGIPLGNLTSQLFSNVYLDIFDQYIKRELKITYYIRYADDFVILDPDRSKLEGVLTKLSEFLMKELSLETHPSKVYFRKFSQGIDFLGYVIFPYHSVLRTKTKARILRKIRSLKKGLDHGSIKKDLFDQSLASYRGLFDHCKGRHVLRDIEALLM